MLANRVRLPGRMHIEERLDKGSRIQCSKQNDEDEAQRKPDKGNTV